MRNRDDITTLLANFLRALMVDASCPCVRD